MRLAASQSMVALSVAAVTEGHAKDGVVYYGLNVKAAPCYQDWMPRNFQAGQNAAGSAYAAENEAFLALLESASFNEGASPLKGASCAAMVAARRSLLPSKSDDSDLSQHSNTYHRDMNPLNVFGSLDWASITDDDRLKMATAAWSRVRADGKPGAPVAGEGRPTNSCAETVAALQASGQTLRSVPRPAMHVWWISQTNSFIENSIEAAILLCGNGMDISNDDLKGLLDLVQVCSYNRDLYKIMRMNSIAGLLPGRTLTVHTVGTRCATSSACRQFRDRRIDTNGGDSEKKSGSGATRMHKKQSGMLLVYRLQALFLKYCRVQTEFPPWLFDTFLPACAALISVEAAMLPKPLHEVIEWHGFICASRPGATTPGLPPEPVAVQRQYCLAVQGRALLSSRI
jgi:hypothetical protein